MPRSLGMPVVAAILSRFDRTRLAMFLEVSLALIDAMDGDAEAEGDPRESDGDEQDFGWTEWHGYSGPEHRLAA